MLDAKVITIAVRREAGALYDAFWRPETFARWASGLSEAGLVPDGDAWAGRGPEGPIRITFSPHNGFGVMDHVVDLGGGRIVAVPLRIVANEEGSHVMLTLFRQPEMSDERFAADEAWVRRDLARLKSLAEQEGS